MARALSGKGRDVLRRYKYAVERGAEEAAMEWLIDVRERAEGILTSEGHVYRREVVENVTITKDENILLLTYHSEHALSVEFGSRPHAAPFEKILQWVLDRGILFDDPNVNAISVDPTIGKLSPEETAQIVWNKIRKQGTRETRFLSRAVVEAPPLAQYVAARTNERLTKAIARGGVA